MSTLPAYPPAVEELLTLQQLCPLGPGQPNLEVRERLAALTPATLLAPLLVRDDDMARACLAGLWLLHNYLDESHTISQEIATPSGSYWHGLMHRREPDPSNAAYWFRRVGEHPVFASLAQEAQNLGLRLRSERWNPFDFIDWCEERRGTGSEQETLLCRVQQREWELLFDFCFRKATSNASPAQERFQ